MKVQQPIRRLLWLGAAGVVLIGLAGMGAARRVTSGAVNPTERFPAAVMQAPLRDLNGQAFRLADFKGKVVVLDLWASWCGPCRAAIPDLVKLGHEYAGRGVQVVGLTVEDPAQAEPAVRQVVRELGVSYPVAWIAPVTAASFIIFENGGAALPQTFILTRDGRIQAKGVSLDDKETRDAVNAALGSES